MFVFARLLAEMSRKVATASASTNLEDSKHSVGAMLSDNTLVQRIQVHWEHLREGINSRQLRYVSKVTY